MNKVVYVILSVCMVVVSCAPLSPIADNSYTNVRIQRSSTSPGPNMVAAHPQITLDKPSPSDKKTESDNQERSIENLIEAVGEMEDLVEEAKNTEIIREISQDLMKVDDDMATNDDVVVEEQAKIESDDDMATNNDVVVEEQAKIESDDDMATNDDVVVEEQAKIESDDDMATNNDVVVEEQVKIESDDDLARSSNQNVLPEMVANFENEEMLDGAHTFGHHGKAGGFFGGYGFGGPWGPWGAPFGGPWGGPFLGGPHGGFGPGLGGFGPGLGGIF